MNCEKRSIALFSFYLVCAVASFYYAFCAYQDIGYFAPGPTVYRWSAARIAYFVITGVALLIAAARAFRKR